MEPWPVDAGPREGRGQAGGPARSSCALRLFKRPLGAFWMHIHSPALLSPTKNPEKERGRKGRSSALSFLPPPSRRLQPSHISSPVSAICPWRARFGNQLARASEAPVVPAVVSELATDDNHGLRRHHPHGHRRHRQWNRPRALPLPTADVLPHLEEARGGAVLGDPVRGDAAQLHDVGAVRPPRGAPAQHARHHHQRHRHGHPARLRRALPPLLRRCRPPQGHAPARRRGRLRRRRRRARAHPRAHPRAPLHDRRRPMRPLRHRHVRRAARRHENGDPDEERGVHAPVPVAGLPRERHLLDCLRAHQIRPLHHHPQRARRALRGGAGGPVRHVLQVHPGDHRGA